MKSLEDIIAYIARRIGYVYYHRPLLYGGSGAGVEQLLFTYHEIWAEIVDRQEELRTIWWKVLEDEDCGSANFSTRYSMNHPDASEQEIAQYVVSQWQKISDQSGIPIPHTQLKTEFEQT